MIGRCLTNAPCNLRAVNIAPAVKALPKEEPAPAPEADPAPAEQPAEETEEDVAPVSLSDQDVHDQVVALLQQAIDLLK